jgi:hypothetical protein
MRFGEVRSVAFRLKALVLEAMRQPAEMRLAA